MPTISQAIAEGARRLQSSGIDYERRTAGILLCHIAGIDRTHLLTKSEEQVGETDYFSYLSLIDRRATGEPIQYLTGHQEFYGLDFIVTPDVLIPRPETEFLVERLILLARESEQDCPLIIDVGTGSGCVAVAVAVNATNARLIATDASQAALDVAQTNASRHRLDAHIEFVNGDLLAPLAGRGLEGAVDLIASNPPYVGAANREFIQREVIEWEPRDALFGGEEGLDFYRRLLVDCLVFLKPGGHLVLEIGFGQVDSIQELVAISSWRLVDVTNDLQGIPRTLTLKKSSDEL